MTVHKLSAGDGYTYLTRQVASGDVLRPAGQGLADYYTARGNPAGRWLGSGAAGLGLAGRVVSEAQMRALFGEGRHPDTAELLAAAARRVAVAEGSGSRAELARARAAYRRAVAGTKLGRAYPKYRQLPPVGERVAARLAAIEAERGRPASASERAGVQAEEARRQRRPVAGFDLVFSPVKSVSLLWALGPPEVRAGVEAAHAEAVADTLAWIEKHAAFTRAGNAGQAQLDTSGLIAAAFDHRDSRLGDPDLHTHVAIANKVLGSDGVWRALDARGLHALGVAASERYNTRLEDAAARRLGVRFTDRPDKRGSRPVREVAGVPAELVRHFSRRRAAIEDVYTDLLRDYRVAHGHEPPRAVQLRLAQQATLQTRQGKAPPRALGEQLADWRAHAVAVLGEHGVGRMLRDSVGQPPAYAPPSGVDAAAVAAAVVDVVAGERATWTRWNVTAEAERVLRPLRFATPADRDTATDAVVTAATGPAGAVRIAAPAPVGEPALLRRASDGQSVFDEHGAEKYTSRRTLAAEAALLDAAQTPIGAALPGPLVEAGLALHTAGTRADACGTVGTGGGVRLDAGQLALVRAFAGDPRTVVVGIGPAGAGKTTAMRAFAAVWAAGGGRVLPLAASSRAAHVLTADLGDTVRVPAENLHKWLHEARGADTGRDLGPVDDRFRLRPGDAVLVDEAGMAGTVQLADLVARARAAGAVVRLLGDPAQLAAVEAGGALRLLEREAGAVHLTGLHRFTDPAEAQATLQLRAGDPAGLGFYTSRNRIIPGSRDDLLEGAYTGWAADIRAGRVSVLVAAAADDVAALNARARLERVAAGQLPAGGVQLHDDTRAGPGDWVTTRANARTLPLFGGRDFVKNGDTWTVTAQHPDGALTVAHHGHGGRVTLPADYVAGHLELAYATTAHRAQGATVDTAHVLVTPEMTREALYVAGTRARARTRLYVATSDLLDVDAEHEPRPARTPHEVLTTVLARQSAEPSATETVRQILADAEALPALVTRYDYTHTTAVRACFPALADQALDPALARRVLTDPTWSALADALGAATAHRRDPVDSLRRAAGERELHTAQSAAQVLHARITARLPATPPGGGPLPWLPPPHAVPDAQLRRHLHDRAQLITTRVEHLAAAAAADPAVTALLGAPAHPDPDPAWRHAAGLITAYREQYAVTGHGSPLGAPPPPDTRQDRARRHVHAAITAAAPPPSPAADTLQASLNRLNALTAKPPQQHRPTPPSPPPPHSPQHRRQGPRLSR